VQSDAAVAQLSVSIIIPVYNDQTGIDACIEALQHQSYPKSLLEVIVVDNGSTTPIRVAAKDSELATVIVCNTPGAYAARNAGIAVASGEVLAFTDADCCPDQDWITAGVAALRSDSLPRVVGGEVTMRLPSNPTAIELYQATTGFAQRENIRDRGFSVTANLFVCRSDMHNIGLFDDSLLSGGDREWSWRASEAGYPVHFAADTIVITSPRSSLRAAILQARRVAGGRTALRQSNKSDSESPDIGPPRSAVSASLWILRHPELGLWDRIRVFCVAVLLYLVRQAEKLRLFLGLKPERR